MKKLLAVVVLALLCLALRVDARPRRAPNGDPITFLHPGVVAKGEAISGKVKVRIDGRVGHGPKVGSPNGYSVWIDMTPEEARAFPVGQAARVTITQE